MKKLLVYCTQLLPTGGIESHILKFCTCMAEKGIAIDLLVPNYQVNNTAHLELQRVCNRIISLKNDCPLYQFAWLVSQLGRLTFTRYDAVYTNGQGNSIWLINKLLCRNRWVHHHHTSGDKQDQATWPKSYRDSLERADATIACSQHNMIEIANSIDAKLEMIPCFSRNVGGEIIRQRASDAPVRFGYFGRLIKEKGIETICELSREAEMVNFEFHFWGKPEQFDNEYFSRYANVFYHGAFETESELRIVVNSIDALLLISSHPEGLPICLLEAMSAGLPWIATDRGGIRDIVNDEEMTVLLPALPDRNQVKAAVIQMAERIMKGQVDRSIQRQHYLSHYSEDVISERWHSMLFVDDNSKQQ